MDKTKIEEYILNRIDRLKKWETIFKHGQYMFPAISVVFTYRHQYTIIIGICISLFLISRFIYVKFNTARRVNEYFLETLDDE